MEKAAPSKNTSLKMVHAVMAVKNNPRASDPQDFIVLRVFMDFSPCIRRVEIKARARIALRSWAALFQGMSGPSTALAPASIFRTGGCALAFDCRQKELLEIPRLVLEVLDVSVVLGGVCFKPCFLAFSFVLEQSAFDNCQHVTSPLRCPSPF